MGRLPLGSAFDSGVYEYTPTLLDSNNGFKLNTLA
jgi:hypothetical protein